MPSSCGCFGPLYYPKERRRPGLNLPHCYLCGGVSPCMPHQLRFWYFYELICEQEAAYFLHCSKMLFKRKLLCFLPSCQILCSNLVYSSISNGCILSFFFPGFNLSPQRPNKFKEHLHVLLQLWSSGHTALLVLGVSLLQHT